MNALISIDIDFTFIMSNRQMSKIFAPKQDFRTSISKIKIAAIKFTKSLLNNSQSWLLLN